MILITWKFLFEKILKGYTGITIWPFVILRDGKSDMSLKAFAFLVNHERIHIRQQLELLVVGFYFLYGFYYIKGLVSGKTKFESYRLIPFERESYCNEKNLSYLKKRKIWAWRHY